MTEKEIKESNNLIAEFMGVDIHYSDIEYRDSRSALRHIIDHYPKDEELKFHSSWNWIMEVVEKIEQLTGNFRIVNNIAIIDGNDEDGYIKIFDEKITGDNKIDATYKMIVNFIKWYNETNN